MKKTFPNWHAETSLIDNQDITNVRPLARVPMINMTDSDDPQLWAARHDYKLSKLNSGQPTDTGVFEALKPESPIHTLGSSIANNNTKKYTFRFPPLSHFLINNTVRALKIKEKTSTLADLSATEQANVVKEQKPLTVEEKIAAKNAKKIISQSITVIYDKAKPSYDL